MSIMFLHVFAYIWHIFVHCAYFLHKFGTNCIYLAKELEQIKCIWHKICIKSASFINRATAAAACSRPWPAAASRRGRRRPPAAGGDYGRCWSFLNNRACGEPALVAAARAAASRRPWPQIARNEAGGRRGRVGADRCCCRPPTTAPSRRRQRQPAASRLLLAGTMGNAQWSFLDDRTCGEQAAVANGGRQRHASAGCRPAAGKFAPPCVKR